MTFFIDEGIKENTIYPLPEDVLLQMSAKVFTLFFFRHGGAQKSGGSSASAPRSHTSGSPRSSTVIGANYRRKRQIPFIFTF